MEKRTAGGGSRGSRLGIACLGVSLGGCLVLGLALASLEVNRREEMKAIKATLQEFAVQIEELRESLARCHNLTQSLHSERQAVQSRSGVGKGGQDRYTYDEYYEDDSYDYDDDEDLEEEDEGGKPGGNWTGAGVQQGKRGRRSIAHPSRYQVRIAKGPKTQHSPMAVQARIFIEKDGRYEELKQKEDQVNRKPSDWGQGGDLYPKAIHYGGETQHYLYMRPHHYKGNSRMYHPGGVFKDWSPASWVRSDADFFMDSHTGEVTVGAPGLYYVYAQIYYDDPADTSGYKILKNGSREFQCTVTTITPSSERTHPSVKRNTCYTGGLLRLLAGDKLSIREVEGHRVTINEKTKSFFGMFRVAAK